MARRARRGNLLLLIRLLEEKNSMKVWLPRFLRTCLYIVLGFAAFAFMVNRPRNYPISPVEQRKPAQVKQFPLLDGQTWDITQYKGKVVIVNFWATWCPPCRAETPALVRISQELKPVGLEVLGVSMDQAANSKILEFSREYKIPYLLARGAEMREYSLGIALPTTLIYDRNGNLAMTVEGAIHEESFKSALLKLLEEK